MKITADDYAVLQRAIKRTIDRTGLSLDNYTSLGLTAKRYRWDLLEKSNIKIGDGIDIDGDVNIYAYANNTHIDTALRNITKTK
ncbi:MAG: hypothetical protein ACI9IT_000868 [Glaciecola sp.]|jgi:hypothetical protein|nr:hypothetical protein [uncultured Glaciecola sp.]